MSLGEYRAGVQSICRLDRVPSVQERTVLLTRPTRRYREVGAVIWILTVPNGFCIGLVPRRTLLRSSETFSE